MNICDAHFFQVDERHSIDFAVEKIRELVNLLRLREVLNLEVLEQKRVGRLYAVTAQDQLNHVGRNDAPGLARLVVQLRQLLDVLVCLLRALRKVLIFVKREVGHLVLLLLFHGDFVSPCIDGSYKTRHLLHEQPWLC